MSSDITCIVTAWRRPQNIPAQLVALEKQSVKPDHIMLWHNKASEDAEITTRSATIPMTVISASPNMGVWPRFLLGLEAKTKYVCVFDDDTLPGSRWLENCCNTRASVNGILGTVGVKFESSARTPHTRHGWPNPVDAVQQVDLVGHSWFFERDWLRYYALEPRVSGPTCGEDYHFSIALRKHLSLGTYVPPHPPGNKEMWGSTNGLKLGTDSVALWRQRGEKSAKIAMHNAYLKTGWKPIAVK